MNHIKQILEEEMFKYYSDNYPIMVENIKKLLIGGESKTKIKNYCRSIVGETQTSRTIGNMIDYVNKQLKN